MWCHSQIYFCKKKLYFMLDASTSAPMERTVPGVPAAGRRYVYRQFPSARHANYVNLNV